MQKNLSQRWITLGFGVTLFISALTGFAQMPIFKRYYIADLPGLGWLAQFYTTYWLHYVSAIALIALSAYLATDYLLQQRKTARLTLLGTIRGAMLVFILATGALLVYRNLPGYRFPPLLVVALDFSHLGMAVLFLITSLAARLTKQPWVVAATNRSS